MAHDLAKAAGGNFLLRIEDIDQSRARAHWEAQIYEDLAWLGIDWPHPVMRQSDRMAAYQAALDALWSRGLLYACTCNRRDIAAATSAPQEGAEPVYGPDGLIYPGTCRTAGHPKSSGALRLDMRKALETLGNTKLSFTENGQGPNAETGKITLSPDQLIDTVGDVVLARRDMGTSYHLSVVLDDAARALDKAGLAERDLGAVINTSDADMIAAFATPEVETVVLRPVHILGAVKNAASAGPANVRARNPTL